MAGETLVYSWVQGKGPGFEDAASVRRQVFVEEQGYTEAGELDDYDAVARHIVGYLNDKPVATARLFYSAEGRWKIGRVAVLPALRGGGHGLALMGALMQKAEELGAGEIYLKAQADKTRFYARAGFAPTGAASLDEGRPHVEMVYTKER